MKNQCLLGRWVILISCGLLLAVPAAAQSHRTIQGLQVWPELQGELALHNGDYLLLALRGQRATDYPSSEYDGRSLGFDERRLTVAYEHFWSDQWSLGGTARVQSFGNRQLAVVPELLLRHRSAVGPLTFGQRLSLERTFPNNAGYYGGPGPEGQTFLRLRVDLEKEVPVGSGGFALRPRLSYEAATHVRLQKAADAASERFIQFTSLRAEVGFRVSEHFDVTPWFAYQTNYLITLPQYNAMGNQISGGNLNLVTPVVGLEARFSLLKNKPITERQLPTQH